MIVNDYPHHPSEIRETIKTAKKSYNKSHVIAIFQPHLFSRTQDFAKEFATSLSGADDLVLLDIYPAREKPIIGIDSNRNSIVAEYLDKNI